MATHAVPVRPTMLIGGRPYPILLPTLRDPRLHLATVIISLQVLGQVAFDFDLSIAQILIAIGTCAVIEMGIAFRKQHVILWPASALLTGNGVSFILRVPGTQHGDWWSTRGAWIYAGTAAISILSKYVIKWRGSHVFNPSNIGLVICFLALGSSRVAPLDFWWGPMSPWMAVALTIIVVGGFLILSRLRLLVIAVGFWLTFAAGIGVMALAGHSMTARWHLGPVTGRYFWWVLVTSPEILVFMFFMISDPKTIPSGRVARLVFTVGVGVLAVLLIAPMSTEFQAKVAVLGSLAIACLFRPVLEAVMPKPGSPEDRLPAIVSWARRRGTARAVGIALVGAAVFAGAVVAADIPARPSGAVAAPLPDANRLPKVTILHSKGVSTQVDRKTSLEVARDLVADLRIAGNALRSGKPSLVSKAADGDWFTQLRRQIAAGRGRAIAVPVYRIDSMTVRLQPASGQGSPTVISHVVGEVQTEKYRGSPAVLVRRDSGVPFHGRFDLQQQGARFLVVRAVGGPPVATAPPPARAIAKSFDGVHLQDVASRVGLDFRQADFRYGTWNDVHSMMGGGVCWIDYNNDGWLDLFVVNSYSDQDVDAWQKHGGLPTSHLYENVHGHFVDVSKSTHTNIAVQGNGCVAVDLGNGYPSLLITTNTYNVLLWNNGDGTFTNITHEAGIDAFGTYGWHTGAAVADVNGDGRPDIFVSGYADVNAPSQAPAGFPLSYKAFPDLLYLNEGPGADGHPRFRNVAAKVGIDRAGTDHSLGAVFFDANRDGRPDLYVANDLDPNRLYLNEPGGPLGFHFVDAGRAQSVADRHAGMGVAAQDWSDDGRADIFITNSRGDGHATYRSAGATGFVDARDAFAAALGPSDTGWGDSWVDLANDGRLDLVIANGLIPITSLKDDARPIQVLENTGHGWEDASKAVGLDPGPVLNGRGLAAADYDNDGRVDIAVNSIAGPLVLLHNTGSSGHWLEVALKPLAPGATLTAVLPNGQQEVRQIQLGSSYLSSEDPRAHFGLGSATSVKELIVSWPDGKVTRRDNVAADQILTVSP